MPFTWDSFKKLIPKKLIDVKIQLIGGDLNIGGVHFHNPDLPSELISQIKHITTVTPEMDKEYERELEERMKAIEDRLSSLSQRELFEETATASVSTFISTITGNADLVIPKLRIKAIGEVTTPEPSDNEQDDEPSISSSGI